MLKEHRHLSKITSVLPISMRALPAEALAAKTRQMLQMEARRPRGRIYHSEK